MDHVLRTTASPTRAGDWALVLAAASIEHRVDERDGHFALLVHAADAAAAEQALAGFDEEGAPEQQPPAPDRGWSVLGVVCAIGFFLMLRVTGDSERGSVWFAAGTASADLIMRGAWWRAVTALTLHADVWHAVSNAVASLVFVTAVGRWLGAGLGALFMLLAGAGGNFLTAIRHRTDHFSIGASTATFAALGLVAGLQVARRMQLRTRPGYIWLPIGAALGLFAMIGVGGAWYSTSQVDYWAHLFGLGVGLLFGVGWAIAQLKRGWKAPRAPVQALLAALTIGIIVGCWLLAFRSLR